MIPQLRRDFLAHWAPQRYIAMLSRLDESIGRHVAFRINETPVFYPQPLLDKMVRYGQELCDQLSGNEEYWQASDNAIPVDFRVPNEPDHPLFVQADFGLVAKEDGTLEPKLVEIQGFPSIYLLQAAMAEAYAHTYGITQPYLLGAMAESEYHDLLRRAIVGEHDPEDVVLLEVDPDNQKTAGDFILTSRLLGIRICPIELVKKEGNRLTFDGRPIKRIYNRAIADEIVRRKVQLNFRFTDDLDVEWAGHPNWFFRLSKFSLPWLRHQCVPESRYLSEWDVWPENLDDYVLKPLYSFAGSGVVIGPEPEQLSAIPHQERPHYILQRRMNFVPTLKTPSGLTNVETRIMYIRDGGSLRPVLTVVRTGRGRMMGVDYNKNLDWVGASAGFYSSEL